MKKITFKIGATIIAFIIVVLCIKSISTGTWVDANNICHDGPWVGTLGSTGKGMELLDNPWLYCVQHDKNYKKGYNYTWRYTVMIDGTKGTCYYIGGTTNVQSFKANAKLAYILGGDEEKYAKGYGTTDYNNDNNRTPRQIALWNYWNEWLAGDPYGLENDSGETVKNGKCPSLTTDASNLIAGAENYANSLQESYNVTSNNMQLTDENGEKKGTISSSNSKIGPFNFNFNGYLDAIEILDDKGEHVTFDNGIKFKQGERTLNTENGGWTNNDGTLHEVNLMSNQDFYIINPSNKIIKNVKFFTKSEKTVYKGEVNILTSSSGHQTFINGGANPFSQTTDTTVNIEVQSVTLRVVKEDTEGNRQDKVGFIIYRANTDGTPYGYLYYGGDKYQTGKLVYNENNENSGFWSGGDDQKSGREGATIFYTSTQNIDGNEWGGFFEISGLPPGIYNIGEVYNENDGYESSSLESYNIQIDGGDISENKYDIARVVENIDLYKNKMPYTQTIQLTLNGGKTYRIGMVDTKKEIKDSTITVIKKNGATSIKPNGVEFKIQSISGNSNGKYVNLKEDGSVEFVNANEAYTFKTGESGSFQIRLPIEYNYKIIETKNPYNGYKNINISDVKISPNTATANKVNNTGSRCTSIEIKNLKADTYTITITDAKGGPTTSNPITLGGIVWVSNNVGGKANSENPNYNSSTDYVVSGAKVYLVNKNSSSVYRSCTTGTNGKYSFSVNGIDLSTYYIRIELNNNYNNCELYKGGNKAKDKDGNNIDFDRSKYVKIKNNYNDNNGCKFYTYDNGIGYTYTGTLGDTEDEKMENVCGLSGIYDKGQNEHINLGLIEISPQQGLTQVVKKVEITTNGYTYTYNYNNNKPTDEKYMTENIPTTNWGTNYGYTKNIYPSDIRAATTEVSGENINMIVKITYTITIENKTTGSYYKDNGFTTNEEDYDLDNFKVTSYEDYLLIEEKELTETFDNDLYSLDDSNWTLYEGNKAKYKNQITVKENGKESIDITFKVKNEAIREILTTGNYSKKEQYATKAEANSYHTWHEEWDWTVEVTKTDKDGNEYTVTKKKHKTKPRPTFGPNYNYADAPAFLFKLSDSRKIAGTVFEDNATEDNLNNHETIGNGKFDSGENTIKNVKVELLKAGTNDYAKMYNYNVKNKNADNAITYTNSNGEYKFENVIPGKYYIRFTYGDGSQKISDGTNLYAGQYKSTIYTQQTPANGESGGKWYLDNEWDRYSLALDNIEDRKFDNTKNSTYNYSSLYEGLDNDRNKYDVTANTPDFDISIEFRYATSGSYKNNYKEFNEMNFGIIKMPVVSVKVYNTISYLTLTLSNGQVITQGDPSKTTTIQYVSTLDENDTLYGFGRGGYVKVEIDTDYLYGSTLEVTYDIKVLNNSDLNYKTKEYYYYGTHGTVNDEYTVFIDRVLYYIDPAMTYMYSTKKDIEIENYSETNEKKLENGSIGINASTENAKEELSKTPKEMLDINLTSDNREIHTYYSKDEDTAKTKSSIEVLSVTTSKLLSTEDDDLEFKNYAEIVKITTDKNGNGNICRFMAPTASFENEAKEVMNNNSGTLAELTKEGTSLLYRKDYRSITTDVATITVTPPTGLKENIIIFISIGIGLIVLIGGIVIIKKKVL